MVAAEPLAEALNGGAGDEADAAARYLRIAAIGLPAALIALSGQGYLRGTGDLRSPLVILIVANLANVVLEVWFVYGLDLGLDGSAAGTVIAQAGMGIAFAWMLLRAPARSRRLNLAVLRPLLTPAAICWCAPARCSRASRWRRRWPRGTARSRWPPARSPSSSSSSSR